MNSAREYLKELIARGQSLQNPQYDINTINSASRLASVYPSNTDIQTWKRDVKAFIYQYLRNHFAYTLIESTLNNTYGSYRIGSIINYLEQVYNDFSFWESIEENDLKHPNPNLILKLPCMMCLFHMQTHELFENKRNGVIKVAVEC